MVSLVCGLEKRAVSRTGSRAVARVYAGADFFGGVGIQADRLYHANRLCDYSDLARTAGAARHGIYRQDSSRFGRQAGDYLAVSAARPGRSDQPTRWYGASRATDDSGEIQNRPQ